MVRPDVAGRKVARAARWLDDAESILSRGREELARDAASRDLAAFYLFLAIQECIDLAAHWVIDDGLAPPEDAASAFDVLAERGSSNRKPPTPFARRPAFATGSPTDMARSTTSAFTRKRKKGCTLSGRSFSSWRRPRVSSRRACLRPSSRQRSFGWSRSPSAGPATR